MTDNLKTPYTKPNTQQEPPLQQETPIQQEPSSPIETIGRGCCMFIVAALLFVIISIIVFFWLNKDNFLSIGNKNRIEVSEAQIISMKEIGEWEFLSINDEELIDTVRHGFFGDDELSRIYYGTLRLGIRMQEAEDGWIKVKKDTVMVVLPPIKLLDENFIDEARTKPFYEKGNWSQEDRARMYEKARHAMKKRCLTANNIKSAEQNACTQFYQLLKSMGFEYAKVRITSSDNEHK